jgi:hypothetical protein
MDDLAAPTILGHLAAGIGKPYLVELPPRSVDAHFNVSLKDTDEAEVFEAVCRLDPGFQCRRDPAVLLMWPSGKEGEASLYSRPLSGGALDASGSVGEVAVQIIEKGSLQAVTRLSMPDAIGRRPASISLGTSGTSTVRDALAALAASAQLVIVAEPGEIRISGLQEPR